MSVLKKIIVIMVTIFVFGCSEDTPQLHKGQPTPSFELATLVGASKAGSMHFPDDMKGKIITVRFWADWCPFCKTEMRDIEPIYQKYHDKGLVILAINVRQDPKTAAEFLSDLNISYDVLLDEDGSVARNYGVAGLPTTFVIDRNGNLHTRILGESTPEVFEKIIKELL